MQALGETLPAVGPGESLVARFRGRSTGERPLTVRRIRPTHGDLHLLELDEIRTREDAKAVCGAELCVPRSRLPALDNDEFYRADLLGLEVRTVSGETLGTVHAFLDLPQHDVLVVRNGAHETLIPMVEGSIHAIDLGAGRIVASPYLDETPAPARASRAAPTTNRPEREPARAGV